MTTSEKQTKLEGKRLKNPYELIWYRSGWSESRIAKNNSKYWTFEIEHNGL